MDTTTAFKYLMNGDKLVQAIKDCQEHRMANEQYADVVKEAWFVKGHRVTKHGKQFVDRYHKYESYLHMCLGWYLVLMIFFVVWAVIEATYMFMSHMAPWMVEIKTLMGYASLIGLVLFVISMIVLIRKDIKLLMMLLVSVNAEHHD